MYGSILKQRQVQSLFVLSERKKEKKIVMNDEYLNYMYLSDRTRNININILGS